MRACIGYSMTASASTYTGTVEDDDRLLQEEADVVMMSAMHADASTTATAIAKSNRTLEEEEEDEFMGDDTTGIVVIAPPPPAVVGYWLIHPTQGVYWYTIALSGITISQLVPSAVFHRNETWSQLCAYTATRCFRESVQVRGNFEVEFRLGTFDSQTDLADTEACAKNAAEFIRSSLSDTVTDRPHNVLFGVMARPPIHDTLDPTNEHKSPVLHLNRKRFELLKQRMNALLAVPFKHTLHFKPSRMERTIVQKTELVFDEVHTLPNYRFRKTFYTGNIPGPGQAKRELDQSASFSGKRLASRIPTFEPDARPASQEQLAKLDATTMSSVKVDGTAHNHRTYVVPATDQGVFCDFKMALSSEIVFPRPEDPGAWSSHEECKVLPTLMIKHLSRKVQKNRVQYRVGCIEISFTHVYVTPTASSRMLPYEDYQIEIEFISPESTARSGTRVEHTIEEWLRIMQDMLSWYAFFALAP
jgi:hypothetical protein